MLSCLARLVSLTLLSLFLTACSGSKLSAGERCETGDECESGYCNRGLCAGSSCDCGTTILDTCSPTGTASADCPSGWVCAGSLQKLYTGGRCLPGCGEHCPDNYECNGMLCVRSSPEPPTVTASAVPDEAPTGTPVTLSAEATSPNGEIIEYQWAVTDEPGAVVVHVFESAGLHQVGVQVTDEAGQTASGSVSVRVCLPDGSGCYYDPLDQQGSCCSSSRCAKPEGETQASCQPTAG